MREKDALYTKEDFTEEDGNKAAELEAEFAEMGGWDAETEAGQLFLQTAERICQKLNGHAARMWEKNKMDTVLWDSVVEAAVSGDAILYFYEQDGEPACQQVDTTNIYFGNENERDLQKQPYILLSFRQEVDKVRETARQNGVPEELVMQITADSDTATQAGDSAKTEVDSGEENGKCMVILELSRKTHKDGRVCVVSRRCTKTWRAGRWR